MKARSIRRHRAHRSIKTPWRVYRIPLARPGRQPLEEMIGQMPANSAARHADQPICALRPLPGRKPAAGGRENDTIPSEAVSALRRSRRSDRFSVGRSWWWRVDLYAGFCTRALRPGDGHPSRPAIARRLLRPTRGLAGGQPIPLLGLAPGGVCRAAEVTPGAGALLPHRFTLTCAATFRAPPSAVCSLWHFPASHPDWVLPSTLPCGVRTFLGRVTSRARTRPSGRLATTAIVAGFGGRCVR
jgi:hypothetical protein